MSLFGPSKAELQAEKDKVKALETEKVILNGNITSKDLENKNLKDKYLQEVEELKNEILFLKNADQNLKLNEEKIVFNQRQIVSLMTRIKLNASASYAQLVDLYAKKKVIMKKVQINYNDCRPFSDRDKYFRKLNNDKIDDGQIGYWMNIEEKQEYRDIQRLHALIVRIDELSKLLSSEQKLIIDQNELLSTLESHARLNEINVSLPRNLNSVITEEFLNWLKKENPESDKIIGINKKIEEMFKIIFSICKNMSDSKRYRTDYFTLNLSKEAIQYCKFENEYHTIKKELESFEESIKKLTEYLVQETIETHKIEVEEYAIKDLEKVIEREIITKAKSRITTLKSINRNMNKR
jgi:hypothetical protein